MKKSLILTAVFMLSLATTVFADTTQVPQVKNHQYQGQRPDIGPRPPKGPDFEKRNAEFEKRLNLTEEQKKQAEDLRKKGFEDMKPVMDKLVEKKAEARKLRASQEQPEKLEQLHKEIGALRKEAHEIRMKNMKDFEAILDKKQQKELKKIKEEGRKKFEAARKENVKNGMPPRPPKDFE